MKEYYSIIRRCLWTFLIVMIVQAGGKFQLPATRSANIKPSGFIEQFASLSAGNAKEITLFSLGLGPYMIAIVLWSTLVMLDIDLINNLSEKQSGLVRRVIIFVFCSFQAVTSVFRFENSIIYTQFPGISKSNVNLALALVLVAGGMIVTFLAEMNVEKGVGKQMVIILPGLMANIPGMLVSGQKNVGFLTTSRGLIILGIVTVLFLYLSVYVYRAEYRIIVQQTGMDVSFKNTYIPIKVLSAGALPFMFGVTLFSLPQLLITVPSLQDTRFLYIITEMFSYSTIPGVITYGIVLVLLIYGFSQVNVRAFDIAKSLRNSGDYILGIVPGIDTEKYINHKLNIMICMNIVYMLLVSIVPLVIGLRFSDVTNLSFYFGSIFMVIVIISSLHEEVRFMFAKRQYKIF